MSKTEWKSRIEQIRAMSFDELSEYIENSLKEPRWRTESVFRDAYASHDLRRWADGGPHTPRLKAAMEELSPSLIGEFTDWRQRRLSPNLLRWIYENLTFDCWDEDRRWTNDRLLFAIAISDRHLPWRHGFFWKESYRLKEHSYGMYVVDIMSSRVATYHDSGKFVNLYHDDLAHPLVRGEALFGLAFAVPFQTPRPLHLFEWESLSRKTCLEALADQTNPYARAGGCFLAQRLGGFQKELEPLTSDETPTESGPVSMYAKEALDFYAHVAAGGS